MLNPLLAAQCVAQSQCGRLVARGQSLSRALQAQSPMLCRLALLALALTLVGGEAMARTRPWAI